MLGCFGVVFSFILIYPLIKDTKWLNDLAEKWF